MILLQLAASLRNTSFCKIFRVLDLLVLSFFDCNGRLSCSLHVLCHVNMYKAGKLIFSSNMLHCAWEGDRREACLRYGFDLDMIPLPSKDKTEADIAMGRINAELPLRLEHAVIDAYGRIVLITEKNVRICIIPDNKRETEQWRLVVPDQIGSDTQHIVCEQERIYEE